MFAELFRDLEFNRFTTPLYVSNVSALKSSITIHRPRTLLLVDFLAYQNCGKYGGIFGNRTFYLATFDLTKFDSSDIPSHGYNNLSKMFDV